VNIRELLEHDWAFQNDLLGRCMSLLQERRIIRNCGEGEYILNRDLDSLSLWDLQSSLPWGMPETKDLEGDIPEPVSGHLPEFDTLRANFEEVEKLSASTFAESLSDYFKRGQKGSQQAS